MLYSFDIDDLCFSGRYVPQNLFTLILDDYTHSFVEISEQNKHVWIFCSEYDCYLFGIFYIEPGSLMLDYDHILVESICGSVSAFFIPGNCER